MGGNLSTSNVNTTSNNITSDQFVERVKNIFNITENGYISKDNYSDSEVDTLNWIKDQNRYEKYDIYRQEGGALDDILDDMNNETELQYESVDLTEELNNINKEAKEQNIVDLFGGADFTKSESDFAVDLESDDVMIGGKKDDSDDSSGSSSSSSSSLGIDELSMSGKDDEKDVEIDINFVKSVSNSNSSFTVSPIKSAKVSKKNSNFYTTSDSIETISSSTGGAMMNKSIKDSSSESTSESNSESLSEQGFNEQKMTSSSTINYKTYSRTSEIDIRPFSSTDTENFSFAKPY